MTAQARKRLVLLFGLLILLGGYVGSFFAIRKSIVSRELTALDLSSGVVAPTTDRIVIRLHYFSTHARVHRAFYAVYYPVHSFLGSDTALLANGGAALRVNPKLAENHADFYVASPSQLRLEESAPGTETLP
jgi:hypothetical protein